jgi:hypothetical protein
MTLILGLGFASTPHPHRDGICLIRQVGHTWVSLSLWSTQTTLSFSLVTYRADSPWPVLGQLVICST